MTHVVLGQMDNLSERLRVPVRVLKPIQTDQAMVNLPGFVSSSTQIDPLAYYEKSKLGRWLVSKEVDPGDSVFGLQVRTAAGPIRIRYEVLIDGESFRSARESTIDYLLKVARSEIAEADNDDTSTPKGRMIAYAKSRGDRATRYELRRRVADLAGGPVLLWTSQDFSAGRNETQTLFALLDQDENGVISAQERERADNAIDNCDRNSDSVVEWEELNSRLKPRPARRTVDSTELEWQRWDANESEHVEDLSVKVLFTNEENKSRLLIDDCVLAEPWVRTTAELRHGLEVEPFGQAVLLSHPKVTIALTAAVDAEIRDNDQISIGVTSEGNALFRHIDRDGDWSLSGVELRDLGERILDLDQNADGKLGASELPILLRVCVAHGAVVHRALAGDVAVVPSSSDHSNDTGQKLTAPAWFVSMDADGDRTLTQLEFLGNVESFNKMDVDENGVLSVDEALSIKAE